MGRTWQAGKGGRPCPFGAIEYCPNAILRQMDVQSDLFDPLLDEATMQINDILTRVRAQLPDQRLAFWIVPGGVLLMSVTSDVDPLPEEEIIVKADDDPTLIEEALHLLPIDKSVEN